MWVSPQNISFFVEFVIVHFWVQINKYVGTHTHWHMAYGDFLVYVVFVMYKHSIPLS